jgi:phospholipase C
MTRPDIRHVFVLMLENRSFDHMLGFSGIAGKDAQSGEPTVVSGLTGAESNVYGGSPYPVAKGAEVSMPRDPLHELPDVVVQLAGAGATYPRGGPYPPIDSSGFVASYVTAGGRADPGEIMRCYTAEQLPVLCALASQFAVCDAWHSSMPGPTWPNRFFAMAASAGGLDRSPDAMEILQWELGSGFAFEHGSLFEALSAAGHGWRVYRGDVGPISGGLPIAGALKGVNLLMDTRKYSRFAEDLQGEYPYALTWIEPNYGAAVEDTYKGGSSQHPVDAVTGGEWLIKDTYEALRASPLWDSSVLIVTWDEHGGFYDHVGPGEAPKPGDKIVTPGPVNQFGFVFDRYGARVPAVIASPYTPAGLIDHRLCDHASIPATVEALFGLSALTERDAKAANVTPLLQLSEPRETPTELPQPTAARAEIVSGPLPTERAAAPITNGNLAGFLHVALRVELQMAPAEQHPAILARVGQLRTRGEALAYIEEMAARLNAA